MQVDGYGDEQIGFHVHLLVQSGLLDGIDCTNTGSQSPEAIPTAITWAGYEFLEASRNEENWSKAKSAAKSAGGMALDVLKSILMSLATDSAKKMLGLQ